MSKHTAVYLLVPSITDYDPEVISFELIIDCWWVFGAISKCWILCTSHAVCVLVWKHSLCFLTICIIIDPPCRICSCTLTATVVSMWFFLNFYHGEAYFACNNTCPLTILHFWTFKEGINISLLCHSGSEQMVIFVSSFFCTPPIFHSLYHSIYQWTRFLCCVTVFCVTIVCCVCTHKKGL